MFGGTTRGGLVAIALVVGVPAEAADVTWTNWTSAVGALVNGRLDVDGVAVDVTFTGARHFAQTSGGTNYWHPSTPYVSDEVPNAPPTSDIIALNQASTFVVTFSEPVTDPVLAVVSLNNNAYRFSHDFEVLSFGPGYWGNGTLSRVAHSPAGVAVYDLVPTGEGHGLIRIPGTFTALSWSTTNPEFWNGFTLGVTDLAANVPCGDGVLDIGESCDDGNRWSGDGCDDTCAVEVGYVCDGAPSLCCLTGVASRFAMVGSGGFDPETGILVVTPDEASAGGAGWFQEPVDLGFDLRVRAALYFGTEDASGADGMSVSLQRDPAGLSALGLPGGGLAVGGLAPLVGVELDTHQNDATYDPSDDHLNVFHTDPTVRANQLTAPVSIVASGDNVEDGGWHTVTLSWDAAAEALAVDVENARRARLSADLVGDHFNDEPGGVFFGVSGATGGLSNAHQVCLRNVTFHHDTDGDGLADGPDADANDDGVPDVEQVACGAAFDGPCPDLSEDGNHNGIPDYREEAWVGPCFDDRPDDGVCDVLPHHVDHDRDGIPNHLDAFQDPPLASDDLAETEEDVPVTVDVQLNDPSVVEVVRDAHIDPSLLDRVLTTVIVEEPAHGAVVVEIDGRVTYTPDADFEGLDAFLYALSDGVAASEPVQVELTVSAVNDAPSWGVPGEQAVDEDDELVLSVAAGNPVTVGDVDAGAVEISLTATNGTLTLADTAGRVELRAGDGVDDEHVVLAGTLSNLNSALDGLTFTPHPHYAGPAEIALHADDEGATGAGGARIGEAVVEIEVAPVNDPPVLTLPGEQTGEGEAPLPITGISVADLDAAGGLLEVTLTVAHGTLTLASSDGLTFGAGDAPALRVFSGVLGDLNAALAEITYVGDPGYRGDDALVVIVDDLGSTGSGGALTDSGAVPIVLLAPPECGDGHHVPGREECDDGNTETEPCDYGETSCTVCAEDCTLVPGETSFCGDDVVDGAHEECDDGNATTEPCAYGQTSCTVCAEDCTLEEGETSYCGDGHLDLAHEACDDGNAITDACAYGETSCTVCTASCEPGPGVVSFCGDGVVDEANGETCDDGGLGGCTDDCLELPDTGDTGDTGDSGDSGDSDTSGGTVTPIDSADTAETGDTAPEDQDTAPVHTGNPADTHLAETADTGAADTAVGTDTDLDTYIEWPEGGREVAEEPEGPVKQGCGCSQAPSGGGLAGLLVALLLVRRRRVGRAG